MTSRSNFWAWHRFYEEPPEKKTEAQCRSHGEDHRAYRMAPQFDPRWSYAQKEAYWKGYYGEEQ